MINVQNQINSFIYNPQTHLSELFSWGFDRCCCPSHFIDKFNFECPCLKSCQGATHAKKKGDVLKLRGAGQEEPHIFHSSEQGIWFTGI